MGRFSLLDIFVELTVLVLAHNQGTIIIHLPFHMKIPIAIFEVQVHAGLPLFIGAIILNMIASETLCSLEKRERKTYIKHDGHPVYVRAMENSGWRKVVVPLLIICTAISLGCAWSF